MTCRFNDNRNTSLALVDFGDEDDFSVVEPMLVFMKDGKEVPVSTIVTSIQAIDVQEDPLLDGYNLTMTAADGQVTNRFCHRLYEVFNRICKLVYRALEAEATEAATEPADSVPAIQATNDTTPPAGDAQAAPEAAIDRRKVKRILSSSKDIIKRHDRYEKLRREGVSDLAKMECGDIVTLGASMQVEAFGCIPLEAWDTINNQAIEVTGEQRTPKFYAYVASEYVRLANECLGTNTA